LPFTDTSLILLCCDVREQLLSSQYCLEQYGLRNLLKTDIDTFILLIFFCRWFLCITKGFEIWNFEPRTTQSSPWDAPAFSFIVSSS